MSDKTKSGEAVYADLDAQRTATRAQRKARNKRRYERMMSRRDPMWGWPGRALVLR